MKAKTRSEATTTTQPQRPAPQRYRPAEHVRSTVEDDGAVLLDLRSGKYFSLSEVGGRIWSCLEESRASGTDETGTDEINADEINADEIVARLRGVFDVDPARLRSDVEAFLDHLAAKGLIHAL